MSLAVFVCVYVSWALFSAVGQKLRGLGCVLGGGRKKKDDRLFSPPKILGISLFFMRNRCGIQTKANKQHVANMSCHFKTKQCCIYQCQLLHIKCIIIGKEPFTQPKSLCVLLTECDKGKRRAITNLIV